jgi:hypothetical protein
MTGLEPTNRLFDMKRPCVVFSDHMKFIAIPAGSKYLPAGRGESVLDATVFQYGQGWVSPVFFLREVSHER